MFVDN